MALAKDPFLWVCWMTVKEVAQEELLSGPTGKLPQVQLWKQDSAKAECRWWMVRGQTKRRLADSNCVQPTQFSRTFSLVSKADLYIMMGTWKNTVFQFNYFLKYVFINYWLKGEKKLWAIQTQAKSRSFLACFYTHERVENNWSSFPDHSHKIFLSNYFWWFRLETTCFWPLHREEKTTKRKKKGRGSSALLVISPWGQISLLTAPVSFCFPWCCTISSLWSFTTGRVSLISRWCSARHHCCTVGLRHLWQTIIVPAARLHCWCCTDLFCIELNTKGEVFQNFM